MKVDPTKVCYQPISKCVSACFEVYFILWTQRGKSNFCIYGCT